MRLHTSIGTITVTLMSCTWPSNVRADSIGFGATASGRYSADARCLGGTEVCSADSPVSVDLVPVEADSLMASLARQVNASDILTGDRAKGDIRLMYRVKEGRLHGELASLTERTGRMEASAVSVLDLLWKDVITPVLTAEPGSEDLVYEFHLAISGFQNATQDAWAWYVASMTVASEDPFVAPLFLCMDEGTTSGLFPHRPTCADEGTPSRDSATLTATPGRPLHAELRLLMGTAASVPGITGSFASAGVVDMLNTVTAGITPLTPGADYTTASGARYTDEIPPMPPVPEPKSVVLFGTGLAGLSFARRRTLWGAFIRKVTPRARTRLRVR